MRCRISSAEQISEEVRPKEMSRVVARMLSMALLVLMLAAAGGGAQAEGQGTVLSIDGYRLIFYGTITEGVSWEAVKDTPQPDAVFYIPLREGADMELFTMTLQQEQGDYTMTLTAPDGSPVPVSFALADRPPGLTDDEKWVFAWAQADVFVLMETMTLTAVDDNEPFRVVTDAYELTYDQRWKSSIRVIPEKDGSLSFRVVIGGVRYPLFRLVYDDSAGDFVITCTNERGTRASLSFYIADVPQELDDFGRDAFKRAKTLINEVAANINLR